MAHTKNYRWACGKLSEVPYELIRWDKFDYSILQYINKVTRAGSKKHGKQVFNDCFIMADTETSKKKKNTLGPNHVCAWSIAIRAYHRNVVCLYGARPDDFCTCVSNILKYMPGDHTIIYFHNAAYDYCFLRKFLFNEFGLPTSQLNTKPYYPISIKFNNGLEIRDSLILAQCKLEKWAQDLDVEHKKAVGKWDYDKIRNQSGRFNSDELLYIQNDVLAGVECLDALCINLNKHVYSMPFTATGIPREDIRDIGRKNKGHAFFKKCLNDWSVQMMMELLFHGGYTHANRNIAGWVQEFASCRDFRSSYPTRMLLNKFPAGKFQHYNREVKPEQILAHADRYAYMFVLSAVNVRLKDPFYPMPMLQKSKLLADKLTVEDNGRIMRAAFISITFNECDLELFLNQYDFDGELRITDVYYAHKDYLPRWFTDYVFNLFKDKSALKGVDAVQYAIAKSKLNSCYGMSVQRPVTIDIKEDYETGLYYEDQGDHLEAKYERYCCNYNKMLPYCVGVWVTSYAMIELYKMAACIDYENGGQWLYSDTDSVYASKWNEEKLEVYNNDIRQQLIDRGYPAFEINGKEFCLGVASPDGDYSEYIALGSKRYCGRSTKDNELHITVSGVPKAGAKNLNNDINNFKPGLVFDGLTSGKKQHTYYMLEPGQEPYIDDKGNLTGDSIDLQPCDYTLDSPYDLTYLDDERTYSLFTPELTEDYD